VSNILVCVTNSKNLADDMAKKSFNNMHGFEDISWKNTWLPGQRHLTREIKNMKIKFAGTKWEKSLLALLCKPRTFPYCPDVIIKH